MLTLTPAAIEFARLKGGTVFLDYFERPGGGCCIPYQPEPCVRFGSPHDPGNYAQQTIEGIVVFIPRKLPDVPLEIDLSVFLGFRRLVVLGWCHA